jgi:hypothetical protein
MVRFPFVIGVGEKPDLRVARFTKQTNRNSGDEAHFSRGVVSLPTAGQQTKPARNMQRCKS